MNSVTTHRTPIVSESRKIRKPLMEKKRRARINDSLETLKQILLDSKTLLKEGTSRKNGQRTAKLEKADILEMTVRYLQHLHQRANSIQHPNKTKSDAVVKSDADSSSEEIKLGVTLIPTKLKTGQIVFIMPPSELQGQKENDAMCENYSVKVDEKVWRPW
ncbi:hypothetical protein WA026_015991 [Henosepilachna vigintioctopunctata]|uniref:BHLH domain-containing protein n=1 Tax=Henosepilachna vigintioctopunctata TaxID=420089 RepID=A0AAW1TZH6_9CUCU